MSGVAVIRHLLASNGAMTAVVHPTRILAGILPLALALPAISVRQVSSVPQFGIRINTRPLVHVDRVQVTVFALSYPAKRQLLQLALAACPSVHGTVNTMKVDNITPGPEGPDDDDETSGVYSGSRDFFVKWATLHPANALLAQDGTPLLAQDGSYLLTE